MRHPHSMSTGQHTCGRPGSFWSDRLRWSRLPYLTLYKHQGVFIFKQMNQALDIYSGARWTATQVPLTGLTRPLLCSVESLHSWHTWMPTHRHLNLGIWMWSQAPLWCRNLELASNSEYYTCEVLVGGTKRNNSILIFFNGQKHTLWSIKATFKLL